MNSSSSSESYFRSIEEQLAVRTNFMITHLEQITSNSIRDSSSQNSRVSFTDSKPLAVWIEVEMEKIAKITIAPINCTYDSDQAWKIPPLMMFTIHNREVYLNISTTWTDLSREVLEKIKKLFGSNVMISGLTLRNIRVTAVVMELVAYFDVTKLQVENSGAPGLENLSGITSLFMIGSVDAGTLKLINSTKNLLNLQVQLDFDSDSKSFLDGIIKQWRSGEREIKKWEVQIPMQWKYLPRDYVRHDIRDKSVLRLRIEEDTLTTKKAVLTLH